MGHPGARQAGLRDAIAPAAADGLLDFGELPADVAHHRFGALAGGGAGRSLHGRHSVGQSTKAVVLAHRGMHLPGAAQPGIKDHQITDPEAHRLTALGSDRDVSLQQQAGLLLLVGPGEGADPTAPGRPARHAQALQLGRIRVGRDRDAVGHGGFEGNRGHCGLVLAFGGSQPIPLASHGHDGQKVLGFGLGAQQRHMRLRFEPSQRQDAEPEDESLMLGLFLDLLSREALTAAAEPVPYTEAMAAEDDELLADVAVAGCRP